MIRYSSKPSGNSGALSHAGFGLIEVLIAAAVVMTGVVALLWVFAVGAITTRVQGEIATQTTLQAQAKMEELMRLDYTELTPGGGTNASSPVPSYCDFLDLECQPVAQADAFYTRQWQISSDPSGRSKTITVIVRSRPMMSKAKPPLTTLMTVRSER